MPEVSTVRVSPTWAVRVMVGTPVAGLSGWGAASTASVATLVNVVSFPASSLKVTRTLMVWPWSSANATNDITNVVGMANYLNLLITCRSPLCMFVGSKCLVPLAYSAYVDNNPVYEVGIAVQHLNQDRIGSSAI